MHVCRHICRLVDLLQQQQLFPQTPPAVLTLILTTLCLPHGTFSNVIGRSPLRWRTPEVQRKHLLARLAVEVQMASGTNER